ncbi:LysR family transcriptional regulator substrate-binding protein [Neobacillus sp. NPDC097160]|uniref:LysR family transcriptional regulator substrate-binding protein n=1 Tax=Neobacillus sp. NPDC097160 TaxID=3364298 RepID=UPI00380D3645
MEQNLFHTKYPGIRIRLLHGRTPDLTQRLKEGLIDCAIVHMPIYDSQLDIRTLATLEDSFLGGAAYQDLASRTLSTSELAQPPFLLLSPGSSSRLLLEQWFAARGFTVKPDIELGSIDLLIEFASLGCGTAFITRSFVKEELRSGKLIEFQ